MRWLTRILLLAALVLGVLAALWWRQASQLRLEATRLSILDIQPDSRLALAQQSVDVLADLPFAEGGWYTALFSFDVQAGFDLSRARRELVEARDRRVAVYHLPAPEIFSADLTGEAGTLVLRDEGSGPHHELIQLFKAHAATRARRQAKRQGLTRRAGERAADVLGSFEAQSGQAVEVHLDLSDNDAVADEERLNLASPLAPLRLSLPAGAGEDWDFMVNGRGASVLSTTLLSCVRAGQPEVRCDLQSMGRLASAREFLDRAGALFDSAEPERRLWLGPLEPTRASFYLDAGSRVFRLRLDAPDERRFLDALPAALDLALGLWPSPDAPGADQRDDWFMSPELWAAADVEARRSYVQSVCQCYVETLGRDARLLPLTVNNGERRWLLAGQGAWEHWRDASDVFQETVRALARGAAAEQTLPERELWRFVLVAALEPRRFGPDRLLLFLEDRLLAFTPAFAPSLSPARLISVRYDALRFGLGLHHRETAVALGSGEKRVEIDDPALARFLTWLGGGEARSFVQLSSR